MANIAEIGFVANTQQLSDAERKLEALVPAAQRAQNASVTASAAMDRMSAAAGGVGVAADKGTQALNRNAAGLAHETTAAGRAATANDNLANSLLRVSTVQDRINRMTGVGAAARSAKESAAVFEHAAALDALRAKYNPIFNVIKQYKAAVFEIREANRLGAISADEMAAALQRQRAAALGSISAIKNNGQIVQNYGNIAGNTSFNTANLAAQFQDIGVTAAMGMNPLQIALQQGTQIALIFGQGGATSALTVFKQAILSVFSPLSLMIIALVGLTAAGLQFLNWVTIGKGALEGLATALENLAVPLTVIAGGFAIAFAPQILSMIVSITSAIAVGLTRAVIGLVMAIGIIPSAFIAIVVGLNFFRDEFTKVFGFDIVAVIKNAANFLIQSFVMGFNYLVGLAQNVPNAVGGAAIGIANNVISIVNKIIETVLSGINKIIEGVNYLRSLAGLSAVGTIEFTAIQGLDNPYSNQFFSNMNKIAAENGKIAGKDYVGGFATMIQDGANAAAGAIRKFAGTLGSESDKAGKSYKRIVEGAKSTIESLKAEQAAIGLGEFAALKLRRETELLNQAREAGIKLTKAQREELLLLANDMASLEYAVNKQREMFDFAKDAVKGFASDVVSGLREGKSMFEAFGDAAMNVLNKLTDKLVNDLIDAIFQVNSAASQGAGQSGGGFGSGILSLFGGLFGGGADVGINSWTSGTSISGLFGFAKGGVFTNGIYDRPTPFSFANGGAFGEMGEAGPEAVMPLARGSDGSLGVLVNGGGRGSAEPPAVYVDIVVNGAENASVREESSVDANGDQFRRFIIDTNRDATARGDYDSVNGARYGNRPQRVIR